MLFEVLTCLAFLLTLFDIVAVTQVDLQQHCAYMYLFVALCQQIVVQ